MSATLRRLQRRQETVLRAGKFGDVDAALDQLLGWLKELETKPNTLAALVNVTDAAAVTAKLFKRSRLRQLLGDDADERVFDRDDPADALLVFTLDGSDCYSGLLNSESHVQG